MKPKEYMVKTNSYSTAEVDKSTLELAEAALRAIERVDTPRLAAMGYEDAAVAVSETRRFLDRLLYERTGKRQDSDQRVTKEHHQ